MADQVVNIYEKKAEEMTAIHMITKKDKFLQTEGGFVALDYDGVHYDRIKVVRLFPFSDENKFISIREYGNGDREIGIIEDLAEMTDETRDILEKQLSLRYFTPIIEKIYSIKDEYGYAYFHVLTDKGECRFAINMGSNSVTKLSDTRLIILDVDENRFEIRDVEKLSQKEKRMLDLFL